MTTSGSPRTVTGRESVSARAGSRGPTGRNGRDGAISRASSAGLPDRVVQGHREGRFVPLALDQRRPIGGREHGEPDAHHEEGDGDELGPWVPCGREEGKPERRTSPGRKSLGQAKGGTRQARSEDGGGDQQKAGNRQQRDSGAPVAGERLGVGLPGGQRDHDGDERRDGDYVDHGQSTASNRHRLGPHRHEQDQHGEQGQGRCERQAGAGEDRPFEHGADR
jgi:hypothetical protein